MSDTRRARLEAIALPLLLLSAALLGGIRTTPDGALVFTPPALMALVLGILLLGAAAQAGVIVPSRLVSAARPALANANGSVLLAAFVVGAAQVFGALTPSRGFFTLVANFFFLTALLLMLTARPDGPRFLRSLALLFGAALLGRHVLLAQLAPAGDNLAGRLFARALEGVTLGALGLERLGSATGYVALAAAATLWIAIWLAQSADA